MDTQRLVLLFIFSFSLLMLWEQWDREHRPKPPPVQPSTQETIPAPAKPQASPGKPSPAVPAVEGASRGETVRVSTDLVIAEIDSLGGSLRHLELLRHKDSADANKNFVLLG